MYKIMYAKYIVYMKLHKLKDLLEDLGSPNNTICHHHHHHHDVTLPARISLTLSCQSSLSSSAPGRSSRLHPVSTQSCCI